MNNIFKKLATYIVVFLITMVTFQSVAFASIDLKGAKSAVLIDATTGKVLYEYNKDEVLAQASVTKLMTYYVVADYIRDNNVPLDKKIEIENDFPMVPPDGSKLSLKKGDVITIKELLESLLIMSANDSAVELEQMCQNATSQPFLDLMNNKAKSLGMNNSVYINTSGLTEGSGNDKKYNHTTAYETSILAKKILDEYPSTLEITSQKKFSYNGLVHNNTNNVLERKKNVDGLKTGFTDEAGYCLVSTESVDPKNKEDKPFRLISVILGAPSESARVDASVNLLDYGENTYENKKVVSKDQVFDIASEYYKGGKIPANPKESVYYLTKKGSKIEFKPTIKENMTSSVKKGETVGKLIIKVGDNTIEEDLIANQDVKSVNIFKKVYLMIKNLF